MFYVLKRSGQKKKLQNRRKNKRSSTVGWGEYDSKWSIKWTTTTTIFGTTTVLEYSPPSAASFPEVIIWIHNKMFFMGWRCQPHTQRSTTRTKSPYKYALDKVWPQFYPWPPGVHFDCLLHCARLQCSYLHSCLRPGFESSECNTKS
jgi:hypothetical protein